jgi:integrase
MAYAEKHGDKLTGRWSGRVRVKGKTFHRTFDRRKDAEGYETFVKLMGEEPPTLSGDTSGITFAQAAEECKRAGGARKRWKAGRDPSVIARLDYVVGVLGAYDIEAVDKKALEKVVESLERRRIGGKPISGGTINNYLNAASSVLSYALDCGYISRKPKLPRPPGGNARKLVLSVAAERAILSHMLTQGWRNDALCVEWLLGTGMRLGELYKLTPEQIGNDHVQLYGDQTKNDTARLVYIDPDLGRRMRALVASGGLPKAYQLRRNFKRAAKACGQPSGMVLHSLRHTTATRLLDLGTNLQVTQQILGHKDINTTLRYSHVAADLKLEAAKKLASKYGQSAPESTVVPFGQKMDGTHG